MKTLLSQIDEKQAAGVKATGFWVLEAGISAETRYEDGTTVGPFIFGVDYGAGCEKANSAPLARKLFAIGVMPWARSVIAAHGMLRGITRGSLGRQFGGDVTDDAASELRV